MNEYFKKIQEFLNSNIIYIIVFISIVFGFTVFIHFYFYNLQYLGLMDSIPRLNFARKILDNLTPGVGQMGAVWLPLPHMLIVPFVAIDVIWHNGIAGSIISIISFVISSTFLYKLILLITKNKLASLVGWLLFVTNPTLLFLQSSPMSESFYVMGIILSIYYFISWQKDQKLPSLLKAGLSLAILTFTRYEGYSILIAIFGTFILYGIKLKLRKNNLTKLQGIFCIFATLSLLGIVLWFLYCLIIFGDGLAWLNIYTGQNAVLSSAGLIKNIHPNIATQPLDTKQSLTIAVTQYFWLNVITCGVLTSLFAFVGSITIITYEFIRKKTLGLLTVPIICFLSLTIFMITGLVQGFIPQITVPQINLESFLTKNTNTLFSSNMRYGVAILPFISILFAYILSKKKILLFFGFILIIIQFGLSIFSHYYVYYDLAKESPYIKNQDGVAFSKLYDKGKILISDTNHQYFIFETNIAYKNFINEGNQEYWITSLKNPTKYATWIVYNENDKTDLVWNYLQNIDNIPDRYDLVYERNSIKIYKIKN